MENLIFLNIKTSKLLSCGLIFMFLFSGCATGIDSEAEKQKLIDAIVPEIKERVLFDNCWTTVGAQGKRIKVLLEKTNTVYQVFME